MFATYWLLGFVITTSLAGDVAKLEYLPKPFYNWYRTDIKSDDRRLKIACTPEGHCFYLKIDYRKHTHWGGNGLFTPRKVISADYQNIVLVYYGSYLLERLMVPKIDSIEDDPLSKIDDSILHSIIPKIPIIKTDPEEDMKSPNEIIIYYSFTNDQCIKGIYTFVNSSSTGQYYVKKYPDKKVDSRLCKRV